MCIIGVAGRKEIFEEIMLQKFPNLMKNITLKIRAAQKTKNKKNTYKQAEHKENYTQANDSQIAKKQK